MNTVLAVVLSSHAAVLAKSTPLIRPLVAHAADGFVTTNVNLRAGPDIGYPLISTIPAGTQIAIQGCTDGWEWCDVIAYGNRGWIDGNYLQYGYQNQRVLVPAYGARIGIPIISFVIGSYWGNYYSDRPFYRNRTSWYNRPFVHRPPPRPNHRPPNYRPPQHRPNRPPVGHRPPPGNRRPSGNRPAPRPQQGAGGPARPGSGNQNGNRPTRPGQGNSSGGKQRPGDSARPGGNPPTGARPQRAPQGNSKTRPDTGN